MDNTEAELESFRRQWREEVSARNKSQSAASSSAQPATSSSGIKQLAKTKTPIPLPSGIPKDAQDGSGEIEPRSFHDLEEKEHGMKLGEPAAQSKGAEPSSALEHYEKAVEKETQGNLGESMHLYRRAFRLNSEVQEQYKNKYYPPESYRPPIAPPVEAVINTARTSGTTTTSSDSVSTLVADFASFSIPGPPPPSELSPPPPCPIASMPDELLTEILMYVAIADLASFGRLSQVCKRLAFLVATEERIWKRVAEGSEIGFAAMHYRFACTIRGTSLPRDRREGQRVGSMHELDQERIEASEGDDEVVPKCSTANVALESPYTSYRDMLRFRPRLRFNGCYISTVNYARPGGASTSQSTWNNPILIVTYYRYLRLYRDGTAISLLTTSEPADVVPHLHKENMHEYVPGSALPTAVMKDALPGRWRLSGPGFAPVNSGLGVEALELEEVVDIPAETEEAPLELEGTLHVETLGVTPKYIWNMAFALGSAGRKGGARNNKLSWKGFWSYNILTDDWGEFGLRHYRPFYWSRVRSWG